MAGKSVDIVLDDDQLQPIPTGGEDDNEPVFEIFKPGDEIPVDEPDEKEPTEAEKELAALKAQLAAQQTDSGSQIAKGFQDLSGVLAGLKQPQVAPTPAPAPFDHKKFNEELKELQFDNPLEANAKVIQTFVAPQMEAIKQQQESIALQNERLDARINDPTIFQSYGAEIDETVKALGGKLGSYGRAIAIVKANHMDDIIAQKVAEALEKAKPAPAPVKPGFTGVTPTPGPAGTVKKTVRVVMSEADEVAALASPYSRDEWIKRQYAAGHWNK